MRNFVTLRSLLNRLPKAVKEESPTIDFLKWFIEGLRLLPDITATINKIEIVEIVHGKVQLGEYVKGLNEIRYLSEEPTEKCLESFAACVQEPEPQDLIPQVCKPGLNYQMFLDSPYYKRNYTLMTFVGEDKSILCKNCPNLYCDSKYTFVVTPEKILYTNLQDGWLCINYDTELCNENGDLMIPDIAQVHEFLIYYALMKHFQNRMFTKEEQTINFYQMYEQKSNVFFLKARGEIIARGINPHTIQQLISGQLFALIQIPETYVYAR